MFVRVFFSMWACFYDMHAWICVHVYVSMYVYMYLCMCLYLCCRVEVNPQLRTPPNSSHPSSRITKWNLPLYHTSLNSRKSLIRNSLGGKSQFLRRKKKDKILKNIMN